MHIKMNSNLKAAAAILLSSIFLGIAFLNMPDTFFDIGGDSAQYIILAESIAHGKGFHEVNRPQEPFCTHFPPVFPLLLSPVLFFFGRNFYLMHLLVFFLGFLSLLFLYRLFKKYSAATQFAFFAVCLTAFNYLFILFCAKDILSEVPYLFLSVCALLAAQEYAEDPRVFSKKGFYFAGAVVLAYFCRYIGLTLFLGAIVFLAISKKIKKIIFLISVFMAVVFVWSLISKFSFMPLEVSHLKTFFLVNNYAPEKGSLLQQPFLFAFRFIDGAQYYAEIIRGILLPWAFKKPSLLREVLSFFFVSLVFLGLWVKFRENKRCALHYYFVFYLLVIIMANHRLFGEGNRYIVPIIPFLFFYFFEAVGRASRFLAKGTPDFTCLVIFCIVFALEVSFLPRVFNYTLKNMHQSVREFILVNEWIKKALPAEGVIFSRKPTVTYLFSGHKSVIYPFTTNQEIIFNSLNENKIRYILIDGFSRETSIYLVPFLFRYKERFRPLQTIGNTWVLEDREGIKE